jgi:hypothetical protein
MQIAARRKGYFDGGCGQWLKISSHCSCRCRSCSQSSILSDRFTFWKFSKSQIACMRGHERGRCSARTQYKAAHVCLCLRSARNLMPSPISSQQVTCYLRKLSKWHGSSTRTRNNRVKGNLNWFLAVSFVLFFPFTVNLKALLGWILEPNA